VKPRTAYIPDRGDAVWITLDPQTGREQAGRRPALVLTSAVYNSRAGLALVCPITNQAKGYPFEVPLPAELSVTGVILCDHIKSLDWQARQVVRICDVPEDVLTQVLQKIATLLT